jgi:hypothetical protein
MQGLSDLRVGQAPSRRRSEPKNAHAKKAQMGTTTSSSMKPLYENGSSVSHGVKSIPWNKLFSVERASGLGDDGARA